MARAIASYLRADDWKREHPTQSPSLAPAFAGGTVGGLRMTAESARTVLMLRQGPLSLCANFKARLPCMHALFRIWPGSFNTHLGPAMNGDEERAS